MNQSDRTDFAKCFAATCLVYDVSPNTDKANAYFSLLSEFSLQQVLRAFSKHPLDPDRGRFFPKPADIVYQITGTEKQQSESLERQAELEWAQIYRASANGNEPKNISIEALAALRSIGGSSKVGYSLEKDIPFLKRDFIVLFKSISQASASQLDESLPCYPLLVSKKTQVAIK